MPTTTGTTNARSRIVKRVGLLYDEIKLCSRSPQTVMWFWTSPPWR